MASFFSSAPFSIFRILIKTFSIPTFQFRVWIIRDSYTGSLIRGLRIEWNTGSHSSILHVGTGSLWTGQIGSPSPPREVPPLPADLPGPLACSSSPRLFLFPVRFLFFTSSALFVFFLLFLREFGLEREQSALPLPPLHLSGCGCFSWSALKNMNRLTATDTDCRTSSSIDVGLRSAEGY